MVKVFKGPYPKRSFKILYVSIIVWRRNTEGTWKWVRVTCIYIVKGPKFMHDACHIINWITTWNQKTKTITKLLFIRGLFDFSSRVIWFLFLLFLLFLAFLLYEQLRLSMTTTVITSFKLYHSLKCILNCAMHCLLQQTCFIKPLPNFSALVSTSKQPSLFHPRTVLIYDLSLSFFVFVCLFVCLFVCFTLLPRYLYCLKEPYKTTIRQNIADLLPNPTNKAFQVP